MKKEKLKIDFLNKLELFYRNYGSDWTIDDFVKNRNQQDCLLPFLTELDKKEILILKEDGRSFTVIDLPSNHKDLRL